MSKSSVVLPCTNYHDPDIEPETTDIITTTVPKIIIESDYFYWYPEFPTVKFIEDEVLAWKDEDLVDAPTDTNVYCLIFHPVFLN